jgi:hypothetical protein
MTVKVNDSQAVVHFNLTKTCQVHYGHYGVTHTA